MLHWLRCMSHPDGCLGLFNDAAEGIAPDRDELEAYAARLGVLAGETGPSGITHLADSGYVRVARGAALALLDLAPIGPDYLPGHAHADTLSFELSLHGRRVVVNGGSSCYGLGAQRLKERGTAWHSTVQVAGQDSSEVWSGFRVGRRARVTRVQIGEREVAGAHDGYRFLPGAPEHSRCWRFEDRTLSVEDRVTPAADAVARFHLAPGLRLQPLSSGCWRVLDGDAELARVQVDAGQGCIEASMHAPRFGVLLPTECLSVTLVDGRATTRWSW